MAKSTVNPNSISAQYTEAMRKQLETAQMSAADIDKLIAKSGVETILTQKNLGQYFRNAQAYLEAITNRFNENKALSAGAPDMEPYMSYWDKSNDTHRGYPGVDFIPAGHQKNQPNYLLNPELMAQWIQLNEREMVEYSYMVYGAQGAPQPGAPAPAGSSPNAGGYSGGGNYGGSKHMSTGFGGGSKALSTGGGSKSLAPPPPPPGMGGGYGGSYGGNEFGMGSGGGYQSENMNFYPTNISNWIEQNLQGVPGVGFLGVLPGYMGQRNQFMAGAMERINELDQFQQRIMMEFQNIDPTTPEGAKAQFRLTNELQNVNSKKMELQDGMMRYAHQYDELTTAVKGAIDKENETLMSIVRNIGK